MVTVNGKPDVNPYRQTPDDMNSLKKPILKKLLHNETKKHFLINSKVVFFLKPCRRNDSKLRKKATNSSQMRK